MGTPSWARTQILTILIVQRISIIVVVVVITILIIIVIITIVLRSGCFKTLDSKKNWWLENLEL